MAGCLAKPAMRYGSDAKHRGDEAERSEREHLLVGDQPAPQLRAPVGDRPECAEHGAVHDVEPHAFFEHRAGELGVADVIDGVGDHADEHHQGAEQTEHQRRDDPRPAAAQGERTEGDDDEPTEHRQQVEQSRTERRR